MPAVASRSLDLGSRKPIVGLTIVLLLSVALNVVLAKRVRSLTHERLARIAEYRLKVGATVVPIEAKRLDGERVVVSYQDSSQPTVLYIFTPSCPWCSRNIDNFKTLVDKDSDGYRFIGISLSEQRLMEYVTKNALKLPVYSRLSPDTVKAYKLGSTPQTIVISPEGKVLQNWSGAYVGQQAAQIEAFFHVTLPGLRELQKAEAAKN